jgi:hypothetical protein
MKPSLVFSRDGKSKGHTTGHTRACPLDGCRGQRWRVKWPDGQHTWPCTKGLVKLPRGWQLL